MNHDLIQALEISDLQLTASLFLLLAVSVLSSLSAMYMGTIGEITIARPIMYFYESKIDLVICSVMMMLFIYVYWYLAFIPTFIYLILTLMRNNIIDQHLTQAA